MNLRSSGYWVATALLAADYGFAGGAALFEAPFMLEVIDHLGYPRYFAAILGVWKLLGALAILVPGRARLKEWAYAGMFFDLTGAPVSHVAAGDDVSAIAAPAALLALWLGSWRLRPADRALAAPEDDGDGAIAAHALRPGMLGMTGSTMLFASMVGAVACAPERSVAPRRASRDTTIEPPAPARSIPEAAAVVDFWRDAGPSMWFAKDPEFDRRFRERFLALHERAARGELDAWTRTPEGSLALLILLDQFPRNAFRDTPRMYATDAQARAVADRAARAGQDRAIEPSLRVFVYLPFGHSEDLADQERAVELCEGLGEPNLSRAKHHREIVRRFGRFPHRNRILGRPMRPEEQRYLDEGGYRG